MKEKFMRIFSPISLTVIAILDIAVLSYGIFAIKKLIQYPHPRVIFFAAAEVFAQNVQNLRKDRQKRKRSGMFIKRSDDQFSKTV